MSTIFAKDVQAVLDFTFDWTAWLAVSETISTATITLASGITQNSQATVGPKVTVWLSGGTAGTTYTVACRIVTSQGRTDERTMRIAVSER